MKNLLLSAALLATVAGNAAYAQAQTTEADKNAAKLSIGVGGTFAKPKIMPRLSRLGLAQLTVRYKLTTTDRMVGKDKQSGQIAGAKVSAFLETTDGELTTDDFQEITDHFYHYFQQQLKAGGIDTVAWSAVAAAGFYKNAEGNTEDNEEEKGSGQVWVTYNANKGNTMYSGGPAFAFGKIKKASNFADETGAPAGYFHLTVDFADVVVGVDINSSEYHGYSTFSRTTTFKYNAAVKPVMKVTQGKGNTMLWNEKSQSETVTLQQDIASDMVYHTSCQQDPSRLKNNLFRFAKEMNPVVVETTRAKYIAAAKNALEKYADAFVAKARQVKKD